MNAYQSRYLPILVLSKASVELCLLMPQVPGLSVARMLHTCSMNTAGYCLDLSYSSSHNNSLSGVSKTNFGFHT